MRIPKTLVSYIEAIRLCTEERRWCMRPEPLVGSGMMIAWRVRNGKLIPLGDHGNVDKADLLAGQWQVLHTDALEREERVRVTGVET